MSGRNYNRGGRRNHQQMNSNVAELFDADLTFTVSVDRSAITHFPAASEGDAQRNSNRLVMCSKYVAGNPSSCAAGSECKFVHTDADIAALEHRIVHVNYAWRSTELVTYDRLPTGNTLKVLAPNNRPPTDDIPSEMVLTTRGATHRKPDTQLSHCAHYYFSRMCTRGAQCNFIHAVHVDATAHDGATHTPSRVVPSHQRQRAAPTPRSAASVSHHSASSRYSHHSSSPSSCATPRSTVVVPEMVVAHPLCHTESDGHFSSSGLPEFHQQSANSSYGTHVSPISPDEFHYPQVHVGSNNASNIVSPTGSNHSRRQQTMRRGYAAASGGVHPAKKAVVFACNDSQYELSSDELSDLPSDDVTYRATSSMSQHSSSSARYRHNPYNTATPFTVVVESSCVFGQPTPLSACC